MAHDDRDGPAYGWPNWSVRVRVVSVILAVALAACMTVGITVTMREGQERTAQLNRIVQASSRERAASDRLNAAREAYETVHPSVLFSMTADGVALDAQWRQAFSEYQREAAVPLPRPRPYLWLTYGAPGLVFSVFMLGANGLQWLRWRRRQARRATGLCLACGYDVRGAADRCPECGESVPR